MKNNKITYLLFALFILVKTNDCCGQHRFNYGIKAGIQYSDPKLYEFSDPFPYYKYSANGAYFYGTSGLTFGYMAGGFVSYNLLKNERIKLNSELYLNRRGYKQKENPTNTGESKRYIIKKTYLDIPLSIKVQPFFNAGFYVEPGINQAILLSQQTVFPATNSASTNFELRRAGAKLREKDLFSFKIGAGWEFKRFDFGFYYQTDKQYEYAQFAIRYKLKDLFK